MESSSATLPVVTDMVAALGVPSHGLWRNVLKFLVAESISNETPHFFCPHAGIGFCDLNQKISPLSDKKNISDGVESKNGSISTPLDPPSFLAGQYL